MADVLGRITAPSSPSSGSTFPLRVVRTPGSSFFSGTDYGYGFTQDRPVVVHQFGELDAKVEQRFAVGLGPRKFKFIKQTLSYAERRSLLTFWESMAGPWSSFLYEAPNSDGRATGSFTVVRVTFDVAPLSITHLANQCQTGITFVEVVDPTVFPAYTTSSIVTRFPSVSLSTALLDQVQQVIPLVHIKVRESAVPDNLYFSDRRCTVNGQLYLPRLQNVGEPGGDTIISQSINGSADNVQYLFANADRAFTLLSNDTDLRLATIDLSLFHTNTNILIQLWKGFVTGFVNDGNPSFSIGASDGLYQVMQQYPLRVIDRQCWKTFNDGTNCPYTAQSTTHGGDPLVCDFYFNSANGCQAHGMDKFFGAHPAQPQTVAGLAQIVAGLRDTPTSTSLVSDTAWGTALKEIYVNDGGKPLRSIPVECTIIDGRDENEFYDALGVIGQGPIGQFTVTQGAGLVVPNADGFPVIIAPMLDGQTAHGFTVNADTAIVTNSNLGLSQQVDGADPQTVGVFALTQLKGGLTTPRAAGTAYAEIRRTDTPGIQPTTIDSHSMSVPISKGLSGWTWDSGGTPTLTAGLVNPFWICVNVLLRSLGLFNATSAVQLQQFVLSSLANSDGVSGTAQIANLPVTPLVGTGTETQFTAQGVLDVQKPLRDWLTEILSCCLGYFTFEYGKLRLGIRENASVTDAFTIGNMLFQSLRLEPINATFERLYIDFADAAYQFQKNTALYVDKSHATYMGRQGAPLTARMNCVMGSSLSQMLRVAATRTREEIGGVTPAEWSAARTATWSTTILALSTSIGQVVSITSPDVPGGVQKYRIASWKLMKDWSIQISAKSVTTSMYDLTSGPKPMDVPPDPLPTLFYPIPFGPSWAPWQVQASAADALFPSEWSFDSDQEYTTMANGNPSAGLVITGKLPVTGFIAACPPPDLSQAVITQSTTGGSIAGGLSYRVSVCALDSTGLPSPPSQILIVQVPSGTNTNTITISGIMWPLIAGLTTYQVFASDQDVLICAQGSGALTDSGGHVYTPANITLSAAFARSTWALPSPFVSKVRIKAKPARHNGVAGFGVTSVSTNTIVASDMVDASGTPFLAVGRIISIIGRPIGSAPYASFLITAHTPSTGTFTVTPNPVGIVQKLDAVVIRNKPDVGNSPPYTSIQDFGYKNSLNAYAGLTDKAEVGAVMRVIKGMGRGQLRKITANTLGTLLTYDQPLQLDPSSIWILEEDGYVWNADTTDTGNGDHLKPVTVTVPCDNLLEKPVVICGFTVDINGVESPDGPNPFREDWVFGAQGTRLISFGDAFTDARSTDGLVKFDTSTGGGGNIIYNIDLTDPTYRNRLMVWQRVNAADTHTVTLTATVGAFDETGSTAIVLTDNVTGPTGTAMFKFWG